MYTDLNIQSFSSFRLEDGVSPGVQQAFASILGETAAVASSEEEDSLSYVDDKDDRDFNVEEEEEAKGVTKERKRRLRQGGKRGLKSKLEEEEEEDMTVGDVFKLEMELNRENRRLMKVRRQTKITLPPFLLTESK